MQKEFQIVVDIEKKILTPSFEVNTLDLKSVKLQITITKGATLMDLTGVTVRMSIRKPDNNVIFQECQIINAKGGKVEITLENQAYLLPGSYSAEIMCFKGSDVVAVTGSFSYKSVRGIMTDEAVESKSEFTAITKTIDEVNKTVTDLREKGTGIDAEARQEIQTVTTQLVEIPKNGYVNTTITTMKERAETKEVNVKDYGAYGDGRSRTIQSAFPNVTLAQVQALNPLATLQDEADWYAIQNAITNSGKGRIFIPIGTYRISQTIKTPKNRVCMIYGAGNRNTVIDVRFSGVAFLMDTGYLHEIGEMNITTSGDTFKDTFTGIHAIDSTSCKFPNLSIFNCKDGVVIEGETYFCSFTRLFVMSFKEKAIFLKTGKTGYTPNSNYFDIDCLRGYSKTTIGSVGIYIQGGLINNFDNGSILHAQTCIYQENGLRNYFTKCWYELYETCVEIVKGSIFLDGHGAFVNTVHPGGRIFDAHGEHTPYSDLTKPKIREDDALKGLWFFNEGEGSIVLDKSGNGKHATLLGTPTWRKDGTWGTGAYFCDKTGHRIKIPNDVIDWSKPFTLFYNYNALANDSLSANTHSLPGLYAEETTGTPKYFVSTMGVSTIVSYYFDGASVSPQGTKSNGRYQSRTKKNIWCFLYIDPINKTVEILDPFGASDPKITFPNSFPIVNPSITLLSGRTGNGQNLLEGVMSMAGVYQRKLTMDEVYLIANSDHRPLSNFDKKVQKNTVLVSPNGSNYMITVDDTGSIRTTKL